jgi:hypothetical protein
VSQDCTTSNISDANIQKLLGGDEGIIERAAADL